MVERRILVLLKNGDEECMKLLFDSYYKFLCMYSIKYVGSFDDAEDIVQDILIQFWQTRKGTDFQGSIKSYLFGAVYKSSLQRAKKKGRIVFEDLEQHCETPSEVIENSSDDLMLIQKEKVMRNIDKLPEKCREIFSAIVFENMPYKDVARHFSVSINTVKTQYSRAMKQMRREG